MSFPNSFNEFEGIIEKDNLQKEKGKLYADDRRGSKVSQIKPGDTVILKEKRTNKLSPNFGCEEFKVMNKNGSELEVKSSRNGRLLKRNSSHALIIANQSGEDTDQSQSDEFIGEDTTQSQGNELLMDPVGDNNHSNVSQCDELIDPVGNNNQSRVGYDEENVDNGFVWF